MIHIIGIAAGIIAIFYVPLLVCALGAMIWDIICLIARAIRHEFRVAIGLDRE